MALQSAIENQKSAILEFARAHGITHCPPSPPFRVVWKHSKDARISEEEKIAEFSNFQIADDWLELAKHYYTRKGGMFDGKNYGHSPGHRNGRQKGGSSGKRKSES
jgi:hypothetical protein